MSFIFEKTYFLDLSTSSIATCLFLSARFQRCKQALAPPSACRGKRGLHRLHGAFALRSKLGGWMVWPAPVWFFYGDFWKTHSLGGLGGLSYSQGLLQRIGAWL